MEVGSLADVSYQAKSPFSATYDEYLFRGILSMGTSRLLANSTTGMGRKLAAEEPPFKTQNKKPKQETVIS